MIIDFIALNLVIVKHYFILPISEELINQSQNKDSFKKIDFQFSYHRDYITICDI
jgi:hypothetical protein